MLFCALARRRVPLYAAVIFGLIATTAAVPAQAQEAPPVPSPPATPPTPQTPAAPSTSPQTPAPPQPTGEGNTAPSPQTATFPALPFALKTDITLRYDQTNLDSRQTGLIPTDDEGTFRQRVRLFFVAPVTFHADAVLGLSSGTTASPTVPFFVSGDGSRGKSFTLARGYFNYYFGKEITPATPVILAGKMDNPFWRGQIGQNTPASGIPNFILPNYSDDIVWDNDVTPEGVALRLPLYPFFKNKKTPVRLTSTSAFYQIEIPTRRTFTGLTSDTYLVTSQLHLDAGPIQAALTYLDFENLNSGLFSPIFQPGFGIDQGTGTSAFLLRSNTGLQATNGHYAYSSSVFGFGKNRFQILHPSIQVLSPYKFRKTIQPFALFDYLKNTSIGQQSIGRGGTIGINRGTNRRDDFAVWGQIREVDADATLATFADGDLGAGTDYKGNQVGAIYHVQDNFAIRALVNDFKGAPDKTNHVRRFFLDFVKLF